MSIALKYTTLKDAALPFHNFRYKYRGRGKTYAAISIVFLAVLLPVFFLYALIGPQGYRPSLFPQAQANDTSFLEEYASTPVPQPIPQNYLSAQ